MELFRALAVLAEPPLEEAARVAEALGLGPMPGADEYTELFVFGLYPYASVYLGPEGMLGGEARDRVCGFWRALGRVPPAEPDHLAVMLALYARLVEMEEGESELVRRRSWRAARKAFLWEHLLTWLPVYLSKLVEVAEPFYRAWGELLAQALIEETKAVGRQERLPLALRDRPGLIDPRGDREVEEFLQSLLSPVRSGMILLRSDLARAAHSLGLGLRLGERKFILRTLLGQDARSVLDWLAQEADGWIERHRLYLETLGGVAVTWEERAAATACLLRELEPVTKEAV
jgi:TorA maturation chaperone TorD